MNEIATSLSGAPPLLGWRSRLPRPSELGKDLGASLVVFLVAVPLAMGIALASGAPILSGLIASVIGGVVVGLLSGAPMQVSGPAAGLAVTVFVMIQKHGFPMVCAMTVAAGILQLAMGALRVARLSMAISPAVIHGMLAGIGVQITLAQLHVVLGDKPQASPWQNLRELPGQIRDLHGPSTLLGVLVIGIMLLWPLVPWKRLKLLPAPLIAVTAATLASLWVDVPRVKIPGGLASALSLPSWPAGEHVQTVLLGALTLALIASAESLLCAVATDRLHGGPRANLDRELMAQGVGNTLSGLIGGLPITGVIVRSKANIDSGARTRLSGILHGLWIALFVTQLGFLINRIPAAVLAGLLCVVGAKLVNIDHIRELHKHGEARIYFITLLGVLATNLLAGIGLGLLAAAVFLIHRLTGIAVDVRERGGSHHVSVRGTLTFLGIPKLSGKLALIPGGTRVEVDVAVDFIDHAGIETLRSFAAAHERTGGTVNMDLLGSGSSHGGTSATARGRAPQPSQAAVATRTQTTASVATAGPAAGAAH
jgi:carbonic anhydrase